MAPSVGRTQVLAYRLAAQQLHRTATSVLDLDVLDLGVQEAMGQPAGYAFAARLPTGTPTAAVGPGAKLALAWSLRGAPHVHRRADLNDLAGALWPLSEADAAGRLNETGPSVAKSGIPALEQYRLAVEAMRTVVTSPIAKGAASTAVTAELPDVMARDCRPCKARHVSDSAMRTTALAGGVELEPATAPPVLLRRSRPRAVDGPDLAALRRLAAAYLRLLGPARPADVAGYVEARRADLVEQAWPDDLVAIEVDGRECWLPADCVAALQAAHDPELVRLLGPFDPYLQARDRELLVPDTSLHKTLWPVLGRPGVLLVDGEVAGIWRTKSSKTKLTLTVETFGAVAPSCRPDIEAEAERIAAVRGAANLALTLTT